MKMTKLAIALSTTCAFAGSANAASILYKGSQQIGQVTANYSFTTNGSTGDVDASAIEAFDVQLVSGSESFSFDQSNGIVFGSFSASQTQARPSASPYGELVFQSFATFGDSFSGYLKLNSQISYAQLVTANVEAFEASDPALIATAVENPTSVVPEPATWAMMLVGFGMVAAAARYRRRSTAITYA